MTFFCSLFFSFEPSAFEQKENLDKETASEVASHQKKLPERKPPGKLQKRKLRIYIDPGHGGKDPGAYVDGIKESTITFAIAKHLTEELDPDKFETKLSRTDNKTSVSLNKRVEQAVDWEADLVLSLHVNSSPHKQVRGAEFFVDPPFQPNLEDYEVMSSHELGTRLPLRWDFSRVRLNNMKNQNKKISWGTLQKIQQFEKSHLLAKELSKLWKRHKLPSGRKKSMIFTSPLFMLKHSPLPTVLVELGYLTHPLEQKILMSEEERIKIAQKISKGLSHFVDKYSTR